MKFKRALYNLFQLSVPSLEAKASIAHLMPAWGEGVNLTMLDVWN